MMNKILSEIKSIPGITGGFLFDPLQGVQLSNLPPLFKQVNLNETGNVLSKLYTMNKPDPMDIPNTFLYYEESTIIIRHIGKTSYIFIIADPSFHQNLLKMTLNMHEEEFKRISANFDDTKENTKRGRLEKEINDPENEQQYLKMI